MYTYINFSEPQPPSSGMEPLYLIYGQNTHIYGKYVNRSQEWRIHDTKLNDKILNSLENGKECSRQTFVANPQIF